MPTYQYACTACDERTEAVQSFTDAPLTECATCQGRLRKVFSAVGVVFKGSGFYKNDSRESKTTAAKADGSKGEGAGKGDSSKADGAGKSDSGAGKGDSAPSTPSTPSTTASGSGSGSGKKPAPAAAPSSTSSTPASKTT